MQSFLSQVFQDFLHHHARQFRPQELQTGKPYRYYDDVCTGWAASVTGGGTYTRELDEDFYVGETLESFAEWFERFRDPILKNKDLQYYFETANRRRGQKKKA